MPPRPRPSPNPPIHRAVIRGDMDQLIKLVQDEPGAVDMLSGYGYTALYLASCHGRLFMGIK